MMKFILIFLVIHIIRAEEESAEQEHEWKGAWFPRNPNAGDLIINDCQNICDNGHNCLQTDFDDEKHKALWTCEDKRSLYEPNLNTSPSITDFDIPIAYEPRSVCMNETIYYGEDLTTFGDYRSVWAKYGEYIYLPPQRYMHNLDLGAVVGLYHPCVNRMQLNAFKTVITSCLYRHLISPSRMLTKERPFALLVWGKSLELSVVEPYLMRDFIKSEAIKTTKNIYSDGNYEKLLIKEASLVTDEKDTELCPVD